MFLLLEFDVTGICGKTAGLLQLVGWVLTIFKIVIPLIIVAFGMFDFGKAVTSGKDEDIKKSAKTLLWRAAAGIIIFFVPTIVMFIFEGFNMFKDVESQVDFNTCKSCILSPWDAAGCASSAGAGGGGS